MNQKKGRASSRLLLIPLAVSAVIGLAGWWCNVEVRKAIETQLERELDAMIVADVTALEIWIDNQMRFVSLLASEEKVKALVENMLQKSPEADARSLETATLKDYLAHRIRQFRLGFVVIDPDAVILSAPFEAMIGDRLHEEALGQFNKIFEKGEPVLLTPYQPPRRTRFGREHLKSPKPFKPFDDHQRKFPNQTSDRNEDQTSSRTSDRSYRNDPFPNRTSYQNDRNEDRENLRSSHLRGRRNRSIMAVAAPIRDRKGNIIAAIGLMISPDQEFTRILSVARPGKTGETYAFDENGIMLSQSRFEKSLRENGLLEKGKGSALNFELRDHNFNLTRIVADAIQGKGGVDVSGFSDYRGVSVVGAWRWLPEYEFGVATKLDSAEAFEPLRVLRLVFLILLLIAALSGVGLFLFSYFNILLQQKMEDATLEAKELGQYTLEKKIGEGGMGVVFRARHALLRRETAIKLLAPEKADEDAIRHFEREVQLTSRLAHPNTIQIFDYGHTPEGIFYYAMEYLDGINLQQLIDHEGHLPEGRVIHILRQICASLNEAHEAGLVHQDIKPANVILCNRGGLPDMVKVLDFGLVKHYRENAIDQNAIDENESHDDHIDHTDHDHTDENEFDDDRTLTIAGTPQFISPEMVKHQNADHRSDLYSLGALAYYLLSGKNVFEGNTFEVMQHHISTCPIPPHIRIGKGLDLDLEKIVMCCLEKDPNARPASAKSLWEQLDACHSAGLWSEKDQAEWWKAFYETQLEDAIDQKSSTILEPTLQINFNERTRLL